MEIEEPQFKIKLTPASGQPVFWRKRGEISLLPADFVDVWIAKFKPDLWRVTDQGEMVGAEASIPGARKIVKVEKEAA